MIFADPSGLGGGPAFYPDADPHGAWTWGDPLPQGMVDFSAGLGDTLSFGATNAIRNLMGTNAVVDKHSGTYSAGNWAGTALATAIAGAAGLEAGGTKGVGEEFSHWIPKRLDGPRSPWNGNYVSPWRHFKHDPYRYPRGNRAWGPKWPAWLQQLDRVPNVYKAGAAGADYGARGTANSKDADKP